MADRDEVKDGVRRTAEGDHRDDRVLDRFLGDDVRRPDVLPEQREHGLAVHMNKGATDDLTPLETAGRA